MRHKFLVVDSAGDESIVSLLRSVFHGREILVEFTADGAAGLRYVKEEKPNVVIFDVCVVGMPGLDFLRAAKQLDSTLPVIMTTGCGKVDEVIESMQLGAFDYLVKPLVRERFGEVVQKALECNLLNRRVRYVHTSELLDQAGVDEDVMIGSSPRLMEIWKQVGKISDSDPTILIEGESGTGKELLARAICNHSRRRGRPFLAVNCAALPDSLLESELFGHEKGAFTDAYVRRIGKFEQCNGGTILLDEIGEMSPASQGKLLRLLENQGFERVGGNQTIRCDVRIIACTNQDLERAVREKRFRLDLYHRLRVVCFSLPPLRERTEDIPLLVDLFCRMFARKYGKTIRGLTTRANEILLVHPWEGNIRELKNAINSAVALASTQVLDLPDFEPLLNGRENLGCVEGVVEDDYYDYFVKVLWPRFDAAGLGRIGELYEVIDRGLEKAVINFVLERCEQNQVMAARLLSMSRNTLRDRIERYRIGVKPDTERSC